MTVLDGQEEQGEKPEYTVLPFIGVIGSMAGCWIPLVGTPFLIVGLICSHRGLRKVRQGAVFNYERIMWLFVRWRPRYLRRDYWFYPHLSRGFAWTGIVFGWLGVAWHLAFMVYVGIKAGTSPEMLSLGG